MPTSPVFRKYRQIRQDGSADRFWRTRACWLGRSTPKRGPSWSQQGQISRQSRELVQCRPPIPLYADAPALRKLLADLRDTTAPDSSDDVRIDTQLSEALQDYQARHDLPAQGKLDLDCAHHAPSGAGKAGLTLPRYSRPSRSNRLKIGDDCLHLIFGQILDHPVHDRRGAKHTLNHEQLLEQIGCMLSGQARKNSEPLGMCTVT